MSENEIAVLGPAGTFTGLAAKKMYSDAQLSYFDCVDDVFKKVVTDGVTGVVAIENSLEGSVGETIENLLNNEVFIVKEYVMPVSFALVAQKNVTVGDVKEVLSHPHALAQCRNYLKSNLSHAVRVGVKSTAEAISLIKDKKDKAAIALSQAAKEQGLAIVEDEIQDSYSETRFIAVNNQKSTGEKTSLIFSLADQPGALYEILKVFATEKINLTKIESRPAKTQIGDYIFFVDFESKKLGEEEIEELLSKIRDKTEFIKYLGSY
jgi:prephenate dehydratase